MDDGQFRQLLEHLGLSWRGYRKVRKGVKKRVRRHMEQLGCRTVSSYILALESQPDVRAACRRLMTVSISRFFRDRRLWEVLGGEILPELIGTYGKRVEIWSAGCASGEEVYSLKILWQGLKNVHAPTPELRITATDMNPVYLERAKAAVYPESSLKVVPDRVRSTWFEKVPGRNTYALTPRLKEGILWRVHDLLYEDPPGVFHLIFLRNNLLTYCQDASANQALQRIVNALAMKGFLIIGAHERLPVERSEIETLGSLSYAFRKKG